MYRSRIHITKILQGSHQQTCADQDYHRQNYLDNHERFSQDGTARRRVFPRTNVAAFSLSAGVSSSRALRKAGARPKAIPVKRRDRNGKREDTPIGRHHIRERPVIRPDETSETINWTPEYANSTPSAPPASESSTLSVSNCRAILRLPAPPPAGPPSPFAARGT